MTRHYELTLIVDSQAGDEAVNQTVGKYESFLNDNGADPVVAEKRGVRKLAYEINKQLQADYTFFQFSGEPLMIHEMDRLLRLDQGILRHLFVKMDEAPVVPVTEEPSIEETAESADGGTDDSEEEEGKE